ncbi:hypothetical protein BLA29_013707, partial [Euroglyphus maynei]
MEDSSKIDKITSMLDATKIFELQNDCMAEIRQQLFDQLENFDSDLDELKEIIVKFEAKLAEAKVSIDDYKKSIDNDSLDIDLPMANIMLSVRSKLIAQLMHLVQERMARLKQNTDKLRENYRE